MWAQFRADVPDPRNQEPKSSPLAANTVVSTQRARTKTLNHPVDLLFTQTVLDERRVDSIETESNRGSD